MSESAAEFFVEHQMGRDLRIHDPSLGYAYTIGQEGVDAVMYDVFTTPVASRSLDVCQLSKDKNADTIPGLEKYRRFQSQTGIYETARYFGTREGISPDELLAYSLVATLDDFAHGVKSHATDIMVEGVGGRETFHETRIAQIIAHGGLRQVFEKHNIRLTQVTAAHQIAKQLGIRIPNWVENDQGEPNLDRVNYIAGESRIWFPDNELVRQATSLDALHIDEDGRFVFDDIELARVWGKLGLLLSSEHWNDPVNRLILLISVETIKRTIFKRYLEGVDEIDNGDQAAPEDYTFFCDSDFDQALERQALDNHRQDGFMTASYLMLQTLGFTERLRFTTHKQGVYADFIADEHAQEYPSPYVNPHIAKFGPLPVFVEVVSDGAEAENIGRVEGRGRLLTTDGQPIGYLKNFKIRQFDPLVTVNGATKRLSEVDSSYAGLLRQHKQAIVYTQAMRLLMNEDAKATFCSAVQENDQAMEQARADYRPLSPDQLRKVISGAGNRALELAISEGRWRTL
jgi:hypothetical protein